MSSIPRVDVRPRGRYVNIDADGVEVGYLTVTSNGRIDHEWAYEFGNRWLIDVVSECYRALLSTNSTSAPSR